MDSGFKVEGLNALVKDLQALGLEVDDLKEVFAKIASEGADEVARFAPSKSGALRKTIRGNRAKNKAVVTAGRARVKYAGPINYGWRRRNIKPREFMQKGDEQMRPRAVQLLEEGINEAIKRKGLG